MSLQRLSGKPQISNPPRTGGGRRWRFLFLLTSAASYAAISLNSKHSYHWKMFTFKLNLGRKLKNTSYYSVTVLLLSLIFTGLYQCLKPPCWFIIYVHLLECNLHGNRHLVYLIHCHTPRNYNIDVQLVINKWMNVKGFSENGWLFLRKRLRTMRCHDYVAV